MLPEKVLAGVNTVSTGGPGVGDNVTPMHFAARRMFCLYVICRVEFVARRIIGDRLFHALTTADYN